MTKNPMVLKIDKKCNWKFPSLISAKVYLQMIIPGEESFRLHGDHQPGGEDQLL